MIINGDCITELKKLTDKSVNCCVTSPPYWGLRDYGHPEQLGSEKTPEEFVSKMVEVFREVKRVLKDDGTLWLNLGDSYAGSGKGRSADGTFADGGVPSKQKTSLGTTEGLLFKTKVEGLKSKDLVGIPWRVAFALQADGWYLRQDIIWAKPNPMPESVTDRCTKSHEYIFLLSKSQKYYYNSEAILEPFVEEFGGKTMPRDLHASSIARGSDGNSDQGNVGGFTRTREGRNKRSVWTVTTKALSEAHFATYPIDLIAPCILAGCPQGGVVLDPFFGSGTTGLAAKSHGRNYIGIELNKKYIEIAEKRMGLLI